MKLPAWTFWALVVVALFIMWARPGRAASTITVDAVCTGNAPCVAWELNLTVAPTGPVALYVTGYDLDSPDEGTFTVNGCTEPMFGPAVTAANDQQVRTVGFQMPASCWRAGSQVGTFAWTRDPVNDRTKHEITGVSLQYAIVEQWVGPVVCLRKGPPARILWGFRNTLTNVRTAFAAEFTPAVHVRLKAFLAAFQSGQGAGPMDLSGVARLSVTPDDIAALWSADPTACQ